MHTTSMVLCKYLKPSVSLSDPCGPLSASVSTAAIREANKAVKSVTGGSAKTKQKHAKDAILTSAM